jgi:N-acetyl-anhydromuramyl-L-alanine amidase AmpD
MRRMIGRRDLIRLGTAGVAGTALLGTQAEAAMAAGETKPPVSWYPAHPENYTEAERVRESIDYIVVHVTQGSWSGSVNWFQNRGANVSAHFVVRSSDGKTAQCVRGSDIAWHAGNWTYNQKSIGIEHEGYINEPRWFTAQMYQASARLTAFLSERWGIPIDRDHIIGHDEVPGSDHSDPGPYWSWRTYMNLVRGYAYD